MRYLFFSLFFCSMALGGAMHAEEIKTLPQVIILLGPPGSGKGTQAMSLSKELKIPHISTGDLFRENIGKNTEFGKRAKSFMDKGQLVPDEVVLEMLFDRVAKPDAAKGYLLDGVPRTIAQAEAIDRHLKGKANLIAINLDVADETIFKRMAGRLTCKQCGNVQNKFLAPPREEGKCDKCGGELTQRSDDKPEVVEERLKVYHKQTKPLIDYYKKKGILVNINGELPADEVYKQLRSAL